MDWLHAIILGIVEGITEFLPVSSTGHLTIVEKLMGYTIDAPGITAFTAIIQIGSIAAAVVYFWSDIVRVVSAWLDGLFHAEKRQKFDYKLGWYVILGSVPVAVIGLLLKKDIETVFRSLWFVVAGLVLWSIVMAVADYVEKRAAHKRAETEVTWRDTLFIGIMQCAALIPGVSRSGSTISAGLFRKIDRVAATRLSFFLGIPALVAAGGLESLTQAKHISEGIGWTPTIIATVAAFVVGYISIAWLLKFISRHDFSLFVWYRLILAAVIIGLLVTGTIGAV